MEEQINIRMSSDDRQLLERLTEIEGESMSTVVRSLIRERGREYGIWPVWGTSEQEPNHVTA